METSQRLGLAQLLTGISPDEFLEHVWCQKPYVCHGDLDRLQPFAANADLVDVYATLEASTRAKASDVRVWYRRPGNPGDVKVDAQTARALYGAEKLTVVVNAIERFIPAVLGLLANIEDDLRTPMTGTTCNAYASPVGTGAGMHFDTQEVFLLQLRGKKRWHFAPVEEVAYPLTQLGGGAIAPVRTPAARLESGGVELPKEMPANAQTATLTPGSVLYMPRGVWHAAEAVDEDSWAITLTFESLSLLELVTRQVDEALRPHALWRRPLAGMFSEHWPRAHAALEIGDQLKALQDIVASLTVEGAREFAATRKRSLRAERSPQYVFAPGVRLTATPGSEAPFEVEAPDGTSPFEVDPEYVPLLEWIARQRGAFSLADAPVGELRENEAVCKFLLEAGLLRAER